MRRAALLAALSWPMAAAAAADDLVTPIRIGRADAPLTLTMWAQPDYSHLAARQGIAGIG